MLESCNPPRPSLRDGSLVVYGFCIRTLHEVGAALRRAQFFGMAQVHSLAGQTLCENPACETNKFTPFKVAVTLNFQGQQT